MTRLPTPIILTFVLFRQQTPPTRSSAACLGLAPQGKTDDLGQGHGAPGAFHTKESEMSILVDKNTRVLCQGITGSAGSFHCKRVLYAPEQ